ncbi:MAG: tRNA (adenosine(37)-N6)-dimethylallyltransferase MiaA [Dehalogenimonas sp.]
MIENKLITILGPTGTGKSELAVKLARLFHGEVVNADSRQLYRRLSIGTAKPNDDEKCGIPHHLLDVIGPDQDCNLAEYQIAALETIQGIQSRNIIPLLTGGTGLYIWATIEGWQIPKVAPDWELRTTLEERAQREGPEALHRYLAEIDPPASHRIDYRNVRRVIRALEVALAKIAVGEDKPRDQLPPYQTLLIGLTADRETLYERIDLRVDKMLEKGFTDEVKTLLAAGFSVDAPAFKSVGYREVIEYLAGKINGPEMTKRIKTQTHRLVRHQYNWFKLNDYRIHWFDLNTDYFPMVSVLVKNFINKERQNNGFY